MKKYIVCACYSIGSVLFLIGTILNTFWDEN